MMSMRNKRKSKVKLYILFLLLAVCSFIFYENKKFQTRIENIYFQKKLAGENIEKTNIKNIFLISDEDKYILYFINFDGNNKKIEDLKSVGNINFSTPILVQKDSYGYINRKGEVVIPLEYTKATNFKDGVAIVKKGKYGVIDEKGKVLLPFEYEEIFLGEKKRVILKKEGVYYTSNLKTAQKIDVDEITEIASGQLFFKKGNEYGIMNIYGKFLVKSNNIGNKNFHLNSYPKIN
ncbi:WG repeat-containing protein [Fusobacterium mortiferum]|uniref:WG repeat-containing protein n=1 Tax=Fusobacterium mortiferum TaxID=850 RepID=UPI001F43FF47|nr:WG repeat-containing protein [Fusobacterium mortiferum]MCF2698723.1 WG repeat-containing protein [Fusobacterium mortiferum]